MADRCENCTKKCPQAEMAHQAALGRMYATKEFTALLKKVESGELVEVVHGRCDYCKDGKSFIGQTIMLANDGKCHTIYYCPNCGAKMDGDGNG